MSDSEAIWLLVIVFIIGFGFGSNFTYSSIEADAIRAGHAQYNSITAKFEWK